MKNENGDFGSICQSSDLFQREVALGIAGKIKREVGFLKYGRLWLDKKYGRMEYEMMGNYICGNKVLYPPESWIEFRCCKLYMGN